MWTLYQQILGDPATPFYSFFIASALDQGNAGMGAAESLAETEKRVALAASGKLRFFPRQIKLFADGAIISQSIQMTGGYLDDHQGEWLMQPVVLERTAKIYWDAGYQLHTHVNGDAGLDVLLDVLERRMRENPRPDHRSVIVHFANSTEAQVSRIASLGAIVSANPYYPVGFADKYGEIGLGPERVDVMVRAHSVVRHGIPLSYHSDLPMALSDPLYLAWCGVNRITPSGRVAAPAQRIDVDHALRAVTIESAYSWRQESELGSIAPGKTANFTVLEQDPYSVAPTVLNQVPVWGTVFEGRVFPVPPAQVRARVEAARAASVPVKDAGAAAISELPRAERARFAVNSAHGHEEGGEMARAIVIALARRQAELAQGSAAIR
jgi:predicted amidohydrolase YtcJ